MARRILSATLVLALAAVPSLAAAAEASPSPARSPLAVDVALHPNGVLVGQVVGESGEPRGSTEVRLTLPDGRSVLAETNAAGGFAFQGVRGVATLSTAGAMALVRTWDAKAAPPRASRGLLLVEGEQIARGQHYAGTGTQRFVDRSKRLFANPFFVAGVIGTAVAIPVAIAQDDDDPAS